MVTLTIEMMLIDELEGVGVWRVAFAVKKRDKLL